MRLSLLTGAWPHKKLGYVRDADKDFTKAIELDKKCAEAYYQLGLLHLLRKKQQQAYCDLMEAQKLGHQQAQSLIQNNLNQ